MNSLWISDTEENKLLNSRISENINFINKSEKSLQKTDVCIIGAGIFGLTCAYYLSKLGYKVIVLEKNNIGEKTTGHTTAKITSRHGLFYDYLTKSYGQKFARDYLEINEHAIKNIKDIIDKEKIKCDFEYQNSYGILEKEAKKYYPYCEILFQWNTKDCISLDKIPYIGSYSSTMPQMFVGTGFKKWGMTLSNVAANIIVDMICGKENKFSYLFNSSRLEPIKNSDEMKNMIVQSANSLFINKLKHTNMNFDKIADNSGSILEINHQKVGIYKDLNGKIYAVKPICTHLGCLLSWNDVDKTWDCPCHGSRFNFDEKNLYDPAFKDLEIYNLGI